MQNTPLVSMEDNDNLPVAGISSLHRYMKEISQYNILSNKESNELAIRYLNYGDRNAAEQMVVSNLRLVVKISLEYKKYWQSSLLDLIQEGNAGLVKAVRKFDPYRGVKFSSYASYWIKAYILKFIMDNWRVVKIATTETMRRMFFNHYREKKQLELQENKVDSGTLAKRLRIKKEQLAGIDERLYGSDFSMNAPVADDSDRDIQDMMKSPSPGVEDTVEQKDLHSKVHKILEKEKDKLSKRERLILYQRLLSDSPTTLQDMGDHLNISRERVRQLEVGLIQKLKKVFCLEFGGDASWAF